MIRRGVRTRRNLFKPTGAPTAPATVATYAPTGLVEWWEPNVGLTLNGSNVAQLTGQVAGLTLAQGTAARQPAYNATSANGNGQASMTFDGAAVTTDALQAASAADWKFLHAGPFTMIAVFYPTTASGNRCFAATFRGAAASIGTMYRQRGDVDRIEALHGNGATLSAIYTGLTPTSVADNVLHIFVARYEEGRAVNEYSFQADGGAATAGNSLAAPSASNPVSPLTIGTSPNGAGYDETGFGGELFGFYLWNVYVPDASISSLKTNYFTPKFGTL